MRSQWFVNVLVHRPALGALIVALLSVAGCAGGSTPPEYPDVTVRASSFELNIRDPRRTFYDQVTEASESYELGSETFPQRLPQDFEKAAIERLDKLRAGEGLSLKVAITIKRADVTFINEPQGKFARYDVALAIKVTTERGVTLEKGSGAAWKEVPEREISEASLAEAFSKAALEAFDHYFASENILNKLNRQIDAYKKAHPDAE